MSSPCSGSNELSMRVANSQKAHSVSSSCEFSVSWVSSKWACREIIQMSIVLAHTFTGLSFGVALHKSDIQTRSITTACNWIQLSIQHKTKIIKKIPLSVESNLYQGIKRFIILQKICRIYIFSWRSERDVAYYFQTLIGCSDLYITPGTTKYTRLSTRVFTLLIKYCCVQSWHYA